MTVVIDIGVFLMWFVLLAVLPIAAYAAWWLLMYRLLRDIDRDREGGRR